MAFILKHPNYFKVRECISKEKAKFCYDYLCLKEKIYNTMINTKYISKKDEVFGIAGDPEVPTAYAIYGDPVMELLLLECKKQIDIICEKEVYPTFGYVRLYKKGDVLNKHKDRPSCEIAASLYIGGDAWPFYIADEKIDMDIGDLVVYDGSNVEHWREEFKDNQCGQVFLFYSINKEKEFDSRPHIGLPFEFAKNG